MATTTKAKEEKPKNYNFGEKKTERIKNKDIPVEFHTPKYKESKNKAIELLNSKEYKDVLLESDFWILVNTYSGGDKAMYSGLIISHDGCLKINDVLDEKLKFKPECLTIDKEGYGGSLVFIYNCPEQGLYEVGEVSKTNCQNGYPYAIALKRCFDRVVLKNSKIAYSGIYSDSESEEFTKRIDEETPTKEETPKTTKKAPTQKGKEIMIQDSQVNIIKNLYKDDVEELKALLKHIGKKKLDELTLLEASSLIKRKESPAKEETPKEEIPNDDDNYLD